MIRRTLTLEDRVGRTLTRLQGLAALADEHHDPRVRAISQILYESIEELEPIAHAPAAISNWKPR